jgi:hypothetical protein
MSTSHSFASYAILQQLEQKAGGIYTPAHLKEVERRLHVIEVEAVISSKRVNNSYFSRI